MEFAARAWPDSEVLVTTHIDKPHIHSHFLVNAVCHQTGRMLRQEKGTLQRLRDLSDELCEAHGFSVLKDTQKNPNFYKFKIIKIEEEKVCTMAEGMFSNYHYIAKNISKSRIF